MTREEIIQQIAVAKGIEHSKEQRDILLHHGGMVVVAGAGSGKTSTITDLIYTLIKSGEVEASNILCTTYSKSGAKEMNAKFRELCNKLGDKTQYNITVKTLHAVYYQILTAFGYTLNVCSEAQVNEYIREAMKQCKVYDNKNSDLVDYVKSLISYQVNRLLTDKQLFDCYLFEKDKLKEESYVQVRDMFSALKRADGVVDFDDIQLQIYNLMYKYNGMYSKVVIDYCHSQWDFFIVDEFQDTSRIQYAILKAMADKTYSDRLVVIGDDDQAIYVWRGTDPNIILEEVMLDYDISRFMLPTNYRCKDSIVDFASNSVQHLSRRHDKQLRAFNSGGKVEILEGNTDTLVGMSYTVAQYIKNLVISGVRASDIAVLVRNNNQVSILNNILMNEGIYSDACSEGMKFTKSALYKDFASILDFSDDAYNHMQVKKYLWKYVPYLGVGGASMVGDIMYELGLSLRMSLAYLLKQDSEFAYKVVDDTSMIHGNAKLTARVQFKYKTLNREARHNLFNYYNLISNEHVKTKDKVKKIINDMYDSVSYMYKAPERNRILKAYVEYFTLLVDKYNSIEDLRAMLQTAEQIESGTGAVLGDLVTLSTVHGAKGLEWKYVIMMCVDDLCMPGYYDICSMIERKYSNSDLYTYIDCERRLYYVGCTRAKEKLVLVGDKKHISPFVYESMQLFNESSNNESIINVAKYGYRYLPNIKERYAEAVKKYMEQ